MHSIKTRKPRGPSERCGVITTEKIFGSAALSWWFSSIVMSRIIG